MAERLKRLSRKQEIGGSNPPRTYFFQARNCSPDETERRRNLIWDWNYCHSTTDSKDEDEGRAV